VIDFTFFESLEEFLDLVLRAIFFQALYFVSASTVAVFLDRNAGHRADNLQ